MYAIEKREWYPYFWIAFAGILLYIKTLPFGYTHQDDTALILYNHDFLSKISNIFQAFNQKVALGDNPPYYRPLLMVSFILNAQMETCNLFFYHLTNIIIHISASCLLFNLLLKLGYGKDVSFLFSILFVIHPVLTQAVAWVPGRNDSLLAFFIIPSFIYFLNFLENHRRGSDYFLNMTFFILALFVKESAIMLIPVCIAYLIFIKKGRFWQRDNYMLIIGWILIALSWLTLRNHAVKEGLGMTSYEIWSLFLQYSPAVLQFIGKILFPFNLSVYPTIRDTSFVYGIIALAVILSGLLLSKNRRNNFVLFGFLWYLFFLLPNLIRPTGLFFGDVMEHRIYVSIIGVIIILMEIDIIKKFSFKDMRLTLIAAVLAIVFFTATFTHADNFTNAVRFWENASKTSPHSVQAHLSRVFVCVADKDLAMAEREARQVLLLDPLSVAGYICLADIYSRTDRFKESLSMSRKALSLDRSCFEAYRLMGAVYYKEGDLHNAELAWKNALALSPGNTVLMKNLAICSREMGDVAQAAYYAVKLKEGGVAVPEDFLRKINLNN